MEANAITKPINVVLYRRPSESSNDDDSYEYGSEDTCEYTFNTLREYEWFQYGLFISCDWLKSDTIDMCDEEDLLDLFEEHPDGETLRSFATMYEYAKDKPYKVCFAMGEYLVDRYYDGELHEDGAGYYGIWGFDEEAHRDAFKQGIGVLIDYEEYELERTGCEDSDKTYQGEWIDPYVISGQDSYAVNNGFPVTKTKEPEPEPYKIEVVLRQMIEKTIKVVVPDNYDELSEDEKSEILEDIKGDIFESFSGWKTVEAYIEQE